MIGDGGTYVEPVGVRYFDGSAWQSASLSVAQGGTFLEAMGNVAYDGSDSDSTDSGPTDPDSDSDSGSSTPSGVLEDFEGDLSAYAGDTGAFSLSTSRPYAGDGHLESSSNGAVWHTGLDTEVGATYEARVWQYAGTFAQVLCCVDGASSGKADLSGYGVEVDFGWSKELSLVRYDGGSSTTLASQPCDQYPESWNRVAFSLDSDGTITASLNAEDGTRIASVSATDTTYASGKLGFGADNTAVSFDDLAKR
jgi:hypothetical protein